MFVHDKAMSKGDIVSLALAGLATRSAAALGEDRHDPADAFASTLDFAAL